ncbi:hypothetical protein ACWDS7_22260, partial [Streptosporangium sp. NPDC003464]
AAGITLVQAGWVLRLFLAEAGVLPPASLLPLSACLVVLELAADLPRRALPAGPLPVRLHPAS